MPGPGLASHAPEQNVFRHSLIILSGTSTLSLACDSEQSQPQRDADGEVEGRAAKRRTTSRWIESQSKDASPTACNFIGDMKKAMRKTLQKDDRFALFCESAAWQILQVVTV